MVALHLFLLLLCIHSAHGINHVTQNKRWEFDHLCTQVPLKEGVVKSWRYIFRSLLCVSYIYVHLSIYILFIYKRSTHMTNLAAAAAKSLQSCPTLCDPRDGSPPGSSVPGILQARILEWVAISFSNASQWKVKVKSLSCVQLFATRWTVAHQAPPSMGFSRQEYWSGLHCLVRQT